MIPAVDAVLYVRTPAVSNYEGVVPQPNGHWGSQIFVHHQRIQLGTFSSEIAAARAHDSASLKFYGDNFFRNFLFTELTIHEPLFQDHFSREAILDMIRNGSYEYKLMQCVRMCFDVSGTITLPDGSDSLDGVFVKEMFRIELTSSDIEIPRKLMLPTEQAMLYFPHLASDTEHQLLNFCDRMRRLREFQYCYSSSAERYVFATGWKSFVDEMELEANDIVVFYRCKEWRNFPPASFDVIDTIPGVTSMCDNQDDIYVDDRL